MDNGNEVWIRKYWRPMVAFLYLAICAFDFILAPILLGIYSIHTNSALIIWTPISVQNGGIIHASFGAILGVYAHGRTKEKMQCNDIAACAAKITDDTK